MSVASTQPHEPVIGKAMGAAGVGCIVYLMCLFVVLSEGGQRLQDASGWFGIIGLFSIPLAYTCIVCGLLLASWLSRKFLGSSPTAMVLLSALLAPSIIPLLIPKGFTYAAQFVTHDGEDLTKAAIILVLSLPGFAAGLCLAFMTRRSWGAVREAAKADTPQGNWRTPEN